MKYTVVKQLYNNSIDNFNNFFYKILDFFKVLNLAFWAFIEIWAELFSGIFNIFLYLYYLILFLLDKLLEAQPSLAFWRTTSTTAPLSLKKGYGAQIFSKPASLSSPSASWRAPVITSENLSRAPKGAKTSIIRSISVFTGKIIDQLKVFFTGIFQKTRKATLKIKPKEEEGSKGLIDEYLKEYEKKKKV